MRAALCLLLLLGIGASARAADEDLLRADQAFRLRAAIEGSNVVAHWDIAPGYYLYKDKFRFAPLDMTLRLNAPVFPRGTEKQDPYFGRTEIYTRRVTVRVPFERLAAGAAARVRIVAQGCNEPLGICYPPVVKELVLPFPNDGGAGASLLQSAAPPAPGLSDKLRQSTEPIDPKEAFRLDVVGVDHQRLAVRVAVGDCCYLYRDKFRFALSGPNGAALGHRAALGQITLPPGELITDEFFGRAEVYRRQVDVALALTGDRLTAPFELRVTYQGCAKTPVAICYEPITRRFQVTPGPDAMRTREIPPAQ